ncbi:MAG: RNA-binding protein [Flavisolibacter sp.]
MNIYVSNLGFNVTEEELKKLFAEHGQVSSVKLITDYNTGSSRGFAFIEMPNDSEGEKAISKLNNFSVNNRNMSVQIARPKEDKPKRNNYPERDGFKKF